MRIRRILFALGVLACLVVGFVAGQYLARLQDERSARATRELHEGNLANLRGAAERWADDVARGQGESVLRAFVAGVAPAVLSERHDSIEIAGVSLLRIPGVVGIHVLSPAGEVIYSSDAKLTTTGEAGSRGAWALELTAFESRPSSRPGVVDLALPIVTSGKTLAVAWLEYDAGAIRDAERPAELGAAGEPASPPQQLPR